MIDITGAALVESDIHCLEDNLCDIDSLPPINWLWVNFIVRIISFTTNVCVCPSSFSHMTGPIGLCSRKLFIQAHQSGNSASTLSHAYYYEHINRHSFIACITMTWPDTFFPRSTQSWFLLSSPGRWGVACKTTLITFATGWHHRHRHTTPPTSPVCIRDNIILFIYLIYLGAIVTL